MRGRVFSSGRLYCRRQRHDAAFLSLSFNAKKQVPHQPVPHYIRAWEHLRGLIDVLRLAIVWTSVLTYSSVL